MTNSKISSIKFENKNIINAITALEPWKAHGYNDIRLYIYKSVKNV